jgi:hypothetical protein
LLARIRFAAASARGGTPREKAAMAKEHQRREKTIGKAQAALD